MARPRNKNSDISFGNYGLLPREDRELQKILSDKDLSAKKVVRSLLRQFIKDNKDYSKA